MKTNNQYGYLWPFDVINMSQLRMEYAKKLKKNKSYGIERETFHFKKKAV